MRIARDRKKHRTQNDLRIPLSLTHRTPIEKKDSEQKEAGKIRKITVSGGNKKNFRKQFFATERKDKAKEEK